MRKRGEVSGGRAVRDAAEGAGRGVGRGLCRVVVCLVAVLAVSSCGGGDPPRVPVPGASSGTSQQALPPIDPANVAWVTGTVSYPQRIALPKGAIVAVELVDLGGAHTSSATVVAEKLFVAGGQVPLSYELPYDRTRVFAAELYGVRARILVDGALWFLNDEPVPVLGSGGSASADVILRPARATE